MCDSKALMLLAITLVGADDPKPPSDAQSSVEPRSSPGVGQQYFQRFAGDWDVVKLLHIRPGDPIRTTGECRQTVINDGRYLRSEFTFDHDGRKQVGLGVLGFEAESGRFTSVWTDSRSTRMSFRQSEDAFDGEQIVLFGRSLEEDRKERYRSRTVTRLEDEGRKIIHRAYTTPADGKERLFMELIMTRKSTSNTAR